MAAGAGERGPLLRTVLGVAAGCAATALAFLDFTARGAESPSPSAAALLLSAGLVLAVADPARHRGAAFAVGALPFHAFAFLSMTHLLDGRSRREALALAILGLGYGLCALTSAALGASLSRFLRRGRRAARS